MKHPRRSHFITWSFSGLALVLLVSLGGWVFSHMPKYSNALQIRPTRSGVMLPDGFYVYQNLSQRGIHIKSITPEKEGLVVQLDSLAQRELAESALQDMLPSGFSIQYCEAKTPQQWIKQLTREQLKFG